MIKKIFALILGLCLLAGGKVYGSEGVWENNGVIICNAGNTQSGQQLVSDGSGGAIIVWQDKRGTIDHDIYAQRVDSGGGIHTGWPANGMIICNAGDEQSGPQLVSDGSGGAIIVWQDKRGTTDYDIYAQRVDSDGNTNWPVNGVIICDAGNNQEYPQMVSDGSGGAIIVWRDERTGNDIYAQRVDSNGVIHSGWLANGRICSTAGNQADPPNPPQMVSDGSGGAIMVWQNTALDTYTQRVDSGGSIPSGWPANGVRISSAGHQGYVWEEEPQLVSDGSGGVIIAWRNGCHYYYTYYYDIYAQKVNGNGSGCWAGGDGGVCICNAEGYQHDPQLGSDGSGGAIIVWRDERAGADIYAQRVDSDGGIHDGWPANGAVICNAGGYQGDQQLVSDGAGDVFVVWRDYRNSETTGYDIYAQRMDNYSSIPNGWPANGMMICNAGGEQAYPQLVSDGSEGAIIAWQDKRGTTDYDICAQRFIRPKPQITNISPASSPWGEKTSNITISGHSFQDDRGVVTYIKITPTVEGCPTNYIKGEELSILSATSLTCNFDLSVLNEAGTWYVVMYDSLGQTGTSSSILFDVYSSSMQGLSWTSALPGQFITGTQDNLAGQINCTAAGYDFLQTCEIENAGTAEAGEDILEINLWQQAGGSGEGITFDPMIAARLGSFISSGARAWTINLGEEGVRVKDGDALYITLDIGGGAQAGKTCRFFLPARGAQFKCGGALPETGIINSNEQIIALSVSFHLDFHSLAPVNTSKGQQGVKLGRIKISNAVGSRQDLSSMLISIYNQSRNEEELGTVFKRLWLNQGENRVGEISAPFGNAWLALSPAISLDEGAEAELELAGDIKTEPGLTIFYLGLPHGQCVNNGNLLSAPVPGRVFPLLSGQVNIRARKLKEAFSNYPNPFQAGIEQTKISYYLNRAGQVKIEVLTLRGKLVKVVVDTHENEGMHETKWDGRNERGRGVRSGVYLLRIMIRYADGGKEKLVRKVAVVR